MWTHKTKFKAKKFLGNYEYSKAGYRKFKLKCSATGKELSFKSYQEAKKEGWKLA